MKNFTLSILAVALIWFSASHSIAQTYGVTTLSGLPVSVADSATSNINAVIDARRSTSIGVFVESKLAGAGTGNITLTFSKGIDQATFGSLGGTKLTMVYPAAGTSAVSLVTNLSTAGFGYLRLDSIANSGGAVLTNLVIKIGHKSGL